MTPLPEGELSAIVDLRGVAATIGTMMRIGLTGGIAAGKSTVAARLRELGALHIDYDALARQIVEPGGVALPQIVAEFVLMPLTLTAP